MARGQCQHTFQRGVGLGPRASGQRVDDRNIPGHGDAPPEEMDVVAFGNAIGLLGIQAGFRRSALRTRAIDATEFRPDAGDDTLAELGALVGFDDDFAGEATRVSLRIRGLLTGMHLERVLGPSVTHPAVLEILFRCGGLAGIRTACKRILTAIAAKNAPRMGAKLVAEIYTALESQTMGVPGAAASETDLPKLADSLKETLQQRKAIGMDVERMLDAHPLSSVLISMPGVGIRTAARILLEVGDGSAFKSAGHLAFAGIAPVTHRSGTSIRGEHPARSGNRKLKRALFLSAFAALHDPTSRSYYDRKRAEGKKHNAALICLARRRRDVLFAMLKNKTLYQPEPCRV